jgi:hypothetical protein
MNKKFTANIGTAFCQWLGVFVGIHLAGIGPGLLLMAQGHPRAGHVAISAAEVLALGWLAYGMWAWRTRPWVGKFAGFLLGFAAVAVLYLIVGLHWTVIAFAGIWCMLATFILGLWAVRRLLHPGFATFGVARTVIDEAIRMKVALVFVVAMLMLVCFLPFALDSSERLEYRLQFFLAWAVGGTAALLSAMTILLACGTICSEIKHRQIFMTMTKPVGRGQYLLGKWMGIALLNALLVGVSIIGIYAFAKMLHDPRLARSADDWHAVNNQVLVSRLTMTPRPADGVDLMAEFNRRVELLRRDDPESYGTALTAAQVRTIQNEVRARWFALEPLNGQTYVFRGLSEAKQLNEVVQLRFKPAAVTSDEMVNMAFFINDVPWPFTEWGHVPIRVATYNFHVVSIPTALIDDAGTLKVRIENRNLLNPSEVPASSINLASEGLQLLYRVDSFEMNLLRSAALIWVRLAFLAILGLAAGTFLGFPVACLFTTLIFFCAFASEFLVESLQNYAGYTSDGKLFWDTAGWAWGMVKIDFEHSRYWQIVKLCVRLIGEAFMLFIPSFAEYNPVGRISTGRHIGYQEVGQATLWIGVIWTGACGVVGWLIFRRRELARITV